MKTINDFLTEANKYKDNLKVCFEMGYDSEKNGATVENCHFGLFATPEMTKAWESGAAKAREDLKQKI